MQIHFRVDDLASGSRRRTMDVHGALQATFPAASCP
jgi:hypothetical protein